jgi:hypothetical protein
MKWRNEQKVLMPKAGDAVVRQWSCEIEHEILFLPSDFPCDERLKVETTKLSTEEVKLREGKAFDALRAVQNAVKTMTALQDRKWKNARGQADNTRASNYIREAQGRRNHHMRTYAACRTAMIALGTLDEDAPQSPFPPLSLEDTFMKSTQRGRGLGDSHRTDGKLWRKHGQPVETDDSPVVEVLSNIHSGKTEVNASKGDFYTSVPVQRHSYRLLTGNGTQMSKRKRGNSSPFCGDQVG